MSLVEADASSDSEFYPGKRGAVHTPKVRERTESKGEPPHPPQSLNGGGGGE